MLEEKICNRRKEISINKSIYFAGNEIFVKFRSGTVKIQKFRSQASSWNIYKRMHHFHTRLNFLATREPESKYICFSHVQTSPSNVFSYFYILLIPRLGYKATSLLKRWNMAILLYTLIWKYTVIQTTCSLDLFDLFFMYKDRQKLVFL